MDILKLPLPQGAVRGTLGVGHSGETGSSSPTVKYPLLNAKTNSNTPRKRASAKLPVINETSAAANQAANTSWKSPSAATPPKPGTKSKSNIVKTNTPSPKRMRKRYLSNPANQHANSPSGPNGAIVETHSPTKKRRRRRSTSLSINGTSTPPKENKNHDNIQDQERRDVSVNAEQYLSCPRKLLRTPTKRKRTQSGSANFAAKSPNPPAAPGSWPPKNNQASAVPPNTTIWGWSPNRGKFKPKSVEYQNGALVEHPEVDGAQLAASFKSKWQSVSSL